MLCTRCKKRQAIVFVQRMEGSETKNEGYCLTCARELHIKPLDDMMQRFGVSDQDLEGMEERMNDFMKEMGENGQMPEGMFPMPTEEPDGDGEDGEDGFTPGGSPVFPFGFGSRQKKEDEEGKKVRVNQYNSLLVPYPLTRKHVFQQLITAKYEADDENKLLNDYNSAILGLEDERKKQPYIDFLADRKQLHAMVVADCASNNVPEE